MGYNIYGGGSVQNVVWESRCGSKTTTHHDKLEVVVDLYMCSRSIYVYTTTCHSKLEVVVVFTKYPWSGKYSHVCMEFFQKVDWWLSSFAV